MTYAEAMNRVEVWFRYWDSPLVDRKKQDAEALAVLRRAVPLIEAAMELEQMDFDAADDCGILTTQAEALLAAALALKESK